MTWQKGPSHQLPTSRLDALPQRFAVCDEDASITYFRYKCIDYLGRWCSKIRILRGMRRIVVGDHVDFNV